jgi:transcriptional regulator with XRE-family HTH domain
MSISTAQMRGARGLLNWSQQDLSNRTDISSTSIGSIENGLSTPRESTMIAIKKAFEDAGIEFLPNDGVRKRSNEVKVFQGRTGFWEFYQDIHGVLREHPGEVVVSNVDERQFEKWLGDDNLKSHIEFIKQIDGISYRIMIKEGDDYFLGTPDFSEYRWMPRDLFASIPFYVYGDKLAILLFSDQPTVITLDYPGVAEAYRAQFNAIWSVSLQPETKTKKSTA